MNQAMHLSEEQLLDVYYGELDASSHLSACENCRVQLGQLRKTLEALRAYAGPMRDEARHAAQVWQRLGIGERAQEVPSRRSRRPAMVRWTLVPALAALLALAFFGGEFFERQRHPDHGVISDKARERVLLISLSDHLDQAQIVLRNVAHAGPDSTDLSAERDRAHELLGANRLLRQTAARLGDRADAALLDDLERTLLDIANSPLESSPEQLREVQERIQKAGLLFKVRVTGAADLAKGQRL